MWSVVTDNWAGSGPAPAGIGDNLHVIVCPISAGDSFRTLELLDRRRAVAMFVVCGVGVHCATDEYCVIRDLT